MGEEDIRKYYYEMKDLPDEIIKDVYGIKPPYGTNKDIYYGKTTPDMK